MDIGTILGVISFLVAITALILIFVFRDFRRSQIVSAIESRLDTFNHDARELLSHASEIIKEVRDIRSASQSLRPDLSIFLVAKQWRFIEKIFRYRTEKHSVAKTIATKYVDDNMNLLLDSGSTTDLVTYELLKSGVTGINIYSNNVFAAMHLVGIKEIPFHLFQGLFSERFAAVYSDEANNRIDSLGVSLFILAATSLRFDTGIMVHKDDPANYDFKRKALMVFRRASESKLLIAVDASKFFEPIDNHRGVFTSGEWMDMIKTAASRIFVITSPPALDFDPIQHAAVNTEIAKFVQAGVQVDNIR